MLKFTKVGRWRALVPGPASVLMTAIAGLSRISHRSTGLRRFALLLAISSVALSSLPPGGRVVSGDERNIEKYAVRRVQPAYPPLAQQQRIEGIVVVQVSVGTSGKVTRVEFLRGNNIFRAVSEEAARKWEFKPPGGEILEGTIRFTFKLDE